MSDIPSPDPLAGRDGGDDPRPRVRGPARRDPDGLGVRPPRDGEGLRGAGGARALVRAARDLGAPQSQGGRRLRREGVGARHPRADLRRGHGGRAARRRGRLHGAAGDRRADRLGRPRRHGRAARDLADAPGRARRLHGDRRRAQRGDLRGAHPRAGRHARSWTGNERVRDARGGGARDRARRRARRRVPPRRGRPAGGGRAHARRSARSIACRCRAAASGLEATIERVASEVLPRSLSHSHPRSFPFIDGSGLEAGVAAAVLAAALDANLGGGAGRGLGGGGRGLALAGRADRVPGRDRPLHERRHARQPDGPGVRPRTRAAGAREHGVAPGSAAVYASEQAHNSIARACDVLGLGRPRAAPDPHRRRISRAARRARARDRDAIARPA